MKKITIEYNLYKFSELSDKAKERALNKFNEYNDFNDILLEDLDQWLLFRLKENNIAINNYKILYSLSYSQGDGVCFTGNFEWNGYDIKISHTGRYYHSRSVGFEITKEHEDESYEVSDEIYEEWRVLYQSICYDLEKNGYETIDYETSEEHFNELCEINDYMFFDSGEMFNSHKGKIISETILDI